VQFFIVLINSIESGHLGWNSANYHLKMSFQGTRLGAFKNSVELHPTLLSEGIPWWSGAESMAV
jgi:hypothetical protein